MERRFARNTVVPSSSCVNTTRSPAVRPIALRISAGMVTCHLLVTVASDMFAPPYMGNNCKARHGLRQLIGVPQSRQSRAFTRAFSNAVDRGGFGIRWMMRRGDVVTVAAAGEYGKPRPAVVVQTDALPAEHASVIVCQMTSEYSEAPDFRVTVERTEQNGLHVRSQILADKPVTI